MGFHDRAAAQGDRHVIFSSSNQVDRRPDSAYAKGKLAGEEMLAGIAGSNGCKVSLFRIANVYGPGSRPFYNSVVATFCWYAAAGRGGELPIHGDGSQVVEFVPVGEVVEILCSSLDQAEPLRRGEIPGQAFSVRELGETITDPEKRVAHLWRLSVPTAIIPMKTARTPADARQKSDGKATLCTLLERAPTCSRPEFLSRGRPGASEAASCAPTRRAGAEGRCSPAIAR